MSEIILSTPAQRLTTWGLIQQEQWHWLAPTLVDLRLNQFPLKTGAELVSNPAFARAVAEKHPHLDPAGLETLFCGELLNLVAGRLVHNAFARLSISQPSTEQRTYGQEIIRYHILQYAPQFVPGKWVEGDYRAYGFEAYLWHFALKKSLMDLKKEIFRHEVPLEWADEGSYWTGQPPAPWQATSFDQLWDATERKDREFLWNFAVLGHHLSHPMVRQGRSTISASRRLGRILQRWKQVAKLPKKGRVKVDARVLRHWLKPLLEECVNLKQAA